MRELVYVSKRKLQQFDLGGWRGPASRVKATAKVFLGVGEITVEPDGVRRDYPNVDAVLRALDQSDRAPVWFEDEVQPGQWVQFEAPMSYTTVGKAVVFLDVDQPSIAYPGGGERRLVLHGSAEHLVGGDTQPRTSVDALSEEAARCSSVGAEAFASVFNHFFDLIEYASVHDVSSRDDRQMVSFRRRMSASGLEHVLPTVGRHLHLPHTAAWMAGCARVTNVAPPTNADRAMTLFATPLFVEYVAAPSVD